MSAVVCFDANSVLKLESGKLVAREGGTVDLSHTSFMGAMGLTVSTTATISPPCDIYTYAELWPEPLRHQLRQRAL